MRGDAEHACLASIQRGLQSLKAQELGLGSEVGSEWRLLSESDGDRLLLSAARAHSLDCHQRTAAGLPVDAWGGRFKLAVRRSPSGDRIEFLVRSDGADGKANTGDDLSSPPGVKTPAPQ